MPDTLRNRPIGSTMNVVLVAGLPALSVALHVIVVLPSGNDEPEAGTQVAEKLPSYAVTVRAV